LSPEANELLTHELREAIGSDEVEVPEDVPDRSEDAHATRPRFVATLVSNRALLIVTFLSALVIGGIVALVTGEYWAVVVALGLHAVGTLVVTAGTMALTTETEHVDPAVAARLEEEGVSDPDRVLSELIEDYAGARQARGVPEVVATGHNERATAPEQDQARASVEQRSAITPTSGDAPPAGSDSAVAALEWWIVAGLAVVSVGLAAIVGGDLWALPAIFLPLAAGWIALQYWMARGRTTPERPTAEGESAQRTLLPISAFIVAGVIWFVLVIGWIGGLI
ncbi:MAG TPA: hypothetical protein VG474_15905, partial [Solirubrobacteraceae bacterium]|nr:hypothetical protein [Solirubrobacteraceae bacterium]